MKIRKITKNKSQIPNKSQNFKSQNSNEKVVQQCLVFCFYFLGFIWNLVLGIWDF
ncbi:hypothetical protein AELI107455_03735 [Aequorivita lipolytica]